jgi:hypothetical protein
MAGLDPAIQHPASHVRAERPAGSPGSSPGMTVVGGRVWAPLHPASRRHSRASGNPSWPEKPTQIEIRPQPEHLATPTPDPSPQGGGRRPALGFGASWFEARCARTSP